MFHTYVILDTAAETPINGADANTSYIVPSALAIQINALEAGTTVKIQSRIHPSASWKDEGTYTSTDGVVLMTFAIPRAQTQVIRTVGTGPVKAFAQS